MSLKVRLGGEKARTGGRGSQTYDLSAFHHGKQSEMIMSF